MAKTRTRSPCNPSQGLPRGCQRTCNRREGVTCTAFGSSSLKEVLRPYGSLPFATIVNDLLQRCVHIQLKTVEWCTRTTDGRRNAPALGRNQNGATIDYGFGPFMVANTAGDKGDDQRALTRNGPTGIGPILHRIPELLSQAVTLLGDDNSGVVKSP